MFLIYNTLSRKKEEFRPRQGKRVRMFVCGPTVYDLPHIGHGRTYLVFDMVSRYLRKRGYEVTYLQNITDVDDKIIARAKERGRAWKSVAREFERAYLQDMARLNIRSVDRFARATEFIDEIVKQVKILERKKHAYLIKGEGYYFDLKTFPRYGRLSGRTRVGAEDAVSRIDESIKKRNKGDFCLWKLSKPGEPAWKTELGTGRPGWHIEDTAITYKIFGPQYDIHGGAIDLIFPHHEAEIAQIEAAYGKRPLVNYWVHPGFLTIRGQKMSKSLGNFITVRELIDSWSSEIFRLFVFSAHYRSPLDYDEDLLAQAASSWERIFQFVERLRAFKPLYASQKFERIVAAAREKFEKAMKDDFDTPKALASFFELIRVMNPAVETGQLSLKERDDALEFLDEVDELFGLLPKRRTPATIPSEVLKLAKKRETLRKEKRFPEADEVRKKIVALGYSIDDTPQGPRVKKGR